MKLAFCLFRYFPFGGLQRDFLQIAKACEALGHEIVVLTTDWQGERPDGWHIQLIDCRGFSNHSRMRDFSRKVRIASQEVQVDGLIGFNKMPGIDIYYAADGCFAERLQHKSLLHRLLPRNRTYANLESAIFSDSNCDILSISPPQKKCYQRHYQTNGKRFHELAPGLSHDRKVPENANEIRECIRLEYQLDENNNLLLMVGSSFYTKGVDRAIRALASLSESHRFSSVLFIIGRGNANPLEKLAEQYGVAQQVKFLGTKDNVPHYLYAADVILQPSVTENTGTAIMEAMNAGKPVIATENCGFAPYVAQADAGLVVPEPYQQEKFNHALQRFLDSPAQARLDWGNNGRKFTQSFDLFNYPERAAQLIESILKARMT